VFGVDADREGAGAEFAPAGHAHAPAQAHHRTGLVQEIILQRAQVAMGVHADQVVTGQCFQQLVVVGQGNQQAGGGQRRMQEEADAVLHA